MTAHAPNPQTLQRLRELPDFLSARIIGQEHVIPRVVPTLQNGELGLSDPGRPKGTFLFLGPTGVGKTEITLLMCSYLFGDAEKHCIRLDMSEYQNQESLQLLLGQGEHSRGNFGRFYDRAQGRGFILFDEIEKAHPRVLDIFLQVLDAARITVANGDTLNLANFYIVATSNIGADALMEIKTSNISTIERFIEDLAASELRPEVLARFNVRCVFQRLNYNAQKTIASIMLNKELQQRPPPHPRPRRLRNPRRRRRRAPPRSTPHEADRRKPLPPRRPRSPPQRQPHLRTPHHQKWKIGDTGLKPIGSSTTATSSATASASGPSSPEPAQTAITSPGQHS
jgi:MoxR-like ATPase